MYNQNRSNKLNRREKREKRKQYFFVIRELTSREIKRKYSRSYLGVIWSVLNPLLMMAVLSMIFTQLFNKTVENYPIYYLSGYVVWLMFMEATNTSITTLVDNKSMLIKVRLPMEVFVLSRIYTSLVNFIYSMVAYIIMLVVFQVVPSITVICFPFIILLVLIFSIGISFILSAAYVFFGDVKHLYTVLTTLWMYCSAIFYPIDSIKGIVHDIIEINPMFQYINAARNVVMYQTWPSPVEIMVMIGWAVVMFEIGYLVFQLNKNKIMQKI